MFERGVYSWPGVENCERTESGGDSSVGGGGVRRVLGAVLLRVRLQAVRGHARRPPRRSARSVARLRQLVRQSVPVRLLQFGVPRRLPARALPPESVWRLRGDGPRRRRQEKWPPGKPLGADGRSLSGAHSTRERAWQRDDNDKNDDWISRRAGWRRREETSSMFDAQNLQVVYSITAAVAAAKADLRQR